MKMKLGVYSLIMLMQKPRQRQRTTNDEIFSAAPQEVDSRYCLEKEMRFEAFETAKHLLKAVKKHIGKEENKRHFLEFVTSEFRKTRNLSDDVAIQQKLKLARHYTFMLNAVHHHKDLLFSYNIAVDRSDEVKRTLAKSAASVALRLPNVYQQ